MQRFLSVRSPGLLLKGIHIRLGGLDILGLRLLGLVHVASVHLFKHSELITGTFAHAAHKDIP